jgi:hypothetical protein
LSACQNRDRWAYNQIESGDKKFNSTKLSHFTSDLVNGLDLEFMRIAGEVRTYLNVHSLPIPSSKEDPKTTSGFLTIGSEKYPFQACRHEGGQRLLLPQDISNILIEALSNNQTVHIKVFGYASSITAEGFEPKFQKMMKDSHLQNPFHLPF